MTIDEIVDKIFEENEERLEREIAAEVEKIWLRAEKEIHDFAAEYTENFMKKAIEHYEKTGSLELPIEKDQHIIEEDQHIIEKDQHIIEKDQPFTEEDQPLTEKNQPPKEKRLLGQK